jgi:SNF2 family DNA or RNA helicase
MKYDVVLTTYSTLVLDYPDDEGAQKKARAKAKKSGGQEEDYFEFQEKGPLLKMSWFRIILDEAQNIRNRQTKMSRAVAGVDALFRWCLTGTPVTK